MYEAYYLLRNRPFGAGSCWLPPHIGEPVQHAVACLQNGSEIVLVTGPSGSGKSAIGRELARQLAPKLRPVSLAHCEFASVGELWRTIQFEAGLEPVPATSDEDARLHVLRAARSLRPEFEGMLIVADDADALSDVLLDELRRLTVQRHEGRPVVQLILTGSFALEERLARPEMSSLTHRIGQHIVLESLTRDQSREYIAQRLQSAGGQLEDVFSNGALEAIVSASDGNFHCLNQLCDHALLLGFANEVRPVSTDIISAALDDLKGLSLPWNLPTARVESELPDLPTSHASSPVEDSTAEVDAQASDNDHRGWWSESGDAAAIEVGAPEFSSSPSSPPEEPVMSTPTDEFDRTLAMSSEAAVDLREIEVQDSYAALDRLNELQSSGPPSASESRWAPAQPAPVAAAQPLPTEAEETPADEEVPRHKRRGVETRLLIDVTQLRNELRAAATTASETPTRLVSEIAPTDPEWDIVQPEPDIPIVSHSREPMDAASLMRSVGETKPFLDVSRLQAELRETESPATAPPRKGYSKLFTRLQERRAATAAESASWPLRLWR